MSAPLVAPAPTISQTQSHRLERSCGRMAPSIARPVRLGIASAKAWAASASTIDHTSSRRCAAAKPSRRRNVLWDVGGVRQAVRG